jgi:hypothetical protein
VYFRTASLALARIKGPEWCERYVKHLLSGSRAARKDRSLNQKIEIKYYGEAELRRKLKPYLFSYAESRQRRELLALRVLTYFTAITVKGNQAKSDKALLARLESVAASEGHVAMQQVLHGIKKLRSAI